MTDHDHFDKRHTDPLIKELICEVRGFRQDMVPIRSFMDEINAAKKAGIWIVGIIAAMGAAIKWFFDMKDHLQK